MCQVHGAWQLRTFGWDVLRIQVSRKALPPHSKLN